MIVQASPAVEVAVLARASLGEGPVWHGGELVWVDIDRGEVHRHSPGGGRMATTRVGCEVGCAVPRAGGGLMLALRDGFAALAPDGRLEPTASVEAGRADTRMNDGACDARGRFWAGTMCLDGDTRGAALYRLDPDGRVTRVLAGISVSNGVGWSPDGTRMYYVDTPRGRVDVFAFDLDSGAIGRREAVIPVPGRPDGLAVDADGGVWVALWGGGAVQRFTADGRPSIRVELPVRQVTSGCFGDADLGTLYVTTAARGTSEPLAGAVFACRPGVTGLPSTPFGG